MNNLSGKTLLVTGGTEGIGKSAAKSFARAGATLVLVGRNPEKTAKVVEEVRAQAPGAAVSSLIGDLSLVADTRRVAEEFLGRHDRLDVLVNNAGAMFTECEVTTEGFEKTFALNHLGYFELTRKLMPLLAKTEKSRVVSTSSGAHRPGKIDFEDIAKRPSGKAGFSVYCDSKLANILFTKALSRRLPSSNVNCFHPGFVETGFGRNNENWTGKAIAWTQNLFARTPDKGAETLVWLATSDVGGARTGEYFYDRKVASVSGRARDFDLAERFWSFSEELTNAVR